MDRILYAAFAGIRKRIMRVLDRRVSGSDSFLPGIMPEELRRLLMHANLSLLDIGGRGGPLAEFFPFAPFTHLFLCEPDGNEAERLEETFKQKGMWREVSVLGEAIHPIRRSVTLNITREPGLSSLLEPDPDIINQFFPEERKGKHSRAQWDVVAHSEVSAISLDNAAKKYGLENLSILKIDTQGTELDILRSGEGAVIPSVVAVFVEAEFLPFYRGQPLFGDVHAYLESCGFRLVDMKRSCLRRTMQHQPAYSKRELAWTHALYFRATHQDGTSLAPKEKTTLALVAALLEFFDYAAALFGEAPVRAYLLEQGFGNAEEDMRTYAASRWHELRKRSGAREERQYASKVWHDRGNER